MIRSIMHQIAQDKALLASSAMSYLQDGSNAMTQLLTKRSTLLQKKADHEKKIRELGSLPMDAFEKFQGKSLSEVNKLLVKAQKQLKKYG